MPRGTPKEKFLEIVSAEKYVSPYGGRVTLLCTMNDGSKWSCNPDGTNFVREVMPLAELNECLLNQLKK